MPYEQLGKNCQQAVLSGEIMHFKRVEFPYLRRGLYATAVAGVG